ncbi:hypothetical protein EJB05_33537 [Eragrostis curvula]|uniref:Uncharacterized protein n=1 Tax=Eragrostis curvula TaxID=38414 RepID=A0A5J9U224_9POAL|nr:hypothetical protein EJB05_33537 [Eragrostis curvula]
MQWGTLLSAARADQLIYTESEETYSVLCILFHGCDQAKESCILHLLIEVAESSYKHSKLGGRHIGAVVIRCLESSSIAQNRWPTFPLHDPPHHLQEGNLDGGRYALVA